jgi:hypothetical protein
MTFLDWFYGLFGEEPTNATIGDTLAWHAKDESAKKEKLNTHYAPRFDIHNHQFQRTAEPIRGGGPPGGSRTLSGGLYSSTGMR